MVDQTVKNLSAVQETQVRSPVWEDPLEEGNGSPLQYFRLENPTDRGAWRAIVHGIAKSWTRLAQHGCTQLGRLLRELRGVKKIIRK